MGWMKDIDLSARRAIAEIGRKGLPLETMALALDLAAETYSARNRPAGLTQEEIERHKRTCVGLFRDVLTQVWAEAEGE